MASKSYKARAAADVPDYYAVRLAILSFTVKGADLLDESSWQALDRAKGPTSGDNVGPLRFEYGLSLSQQKSKATKCKVTWKGRQLKGDPIIKREPKSGGTFITLCSDDTPVCSDLRY